MSFFLTHNRRMHYHKVHRKEYSEKVKNMHEKRPKSPPIRRKPLPCSFCGVAQATPEELESHENLHRSRACPFSCLICEDAKLPTAVALAKHMTNTHPQNSWKQCDACGKYFKSTSLLLNHVNHVHGRCQYRCSYCWKVFRTEGTWKRHEKNCYRAPQNSYQNVCEICGKVFKDYRILRMHSRVHKDERPYNCRVCGATFKRKCHLMVHEEKHAGLVFKCPDCPMEFPTERYLKFHSKRHLPRVLKRTPSYKKRPGKKGGKPNNKKGIDGPSRSQDNMEEEEDSCSSSEASEEEMMEQVWS